MKFPFSLRLTIPASLLLFGVFLGFSSFFYEVNTAFQRIELDVRRRAAFLGNQISGTLQHELARQDFSRAALQISLSGSNPNLRITAVCDHEDRIILSTRHELENQRLENTPLLSAAATFRAAREKMSAQFLVTPDGNTLLAVFPFLLPPEPGKLRSSESAMLYLEYDLSFMKEVETAAAAKRSLIIGGILGVFCLFIWLFFDRTVTHRAGKLLHATQRLSSGDYEARARLRGSDELADIAKAFDQMAGSIRTRTEELELANNKMRREITEREFAENRFLSVWRSSVDGMRLTDQHGNILAVNDAFCRLVGMNSDELDGKPFTTCYAETSNPEEMVEKYQQRFANRHIETIIDREVTFRSGKIAAIEVSSSFIAQDNQEPLLLCIFRDITARKQAEELLQQQAASMKASMDGMGILDREGKFIYLNEAHARIYGYDDPQDLIGESWELLYDGDELCRFKQYIMPAMWKTGGWRGEAVGRKRDGANFPQEISLSRIDSGGMVCVVRDITRRKQEEERRKAIDRKLLDAQKLESLGVLAGGIAHDFNNLLTAIIGHANLAMMHSNAQPKVHTHLTNIEKTSMQAADLCKQMLAYSGRGKFIIQRLSINNVITDMMHLLNISVHKRVSLSYDLGSTLPAVEADASQIRQIVMNLVINGSEAIGDQDGAVSVSTSLVRADTTSIGNAYLSPELPEGDYVCLKVVDTGCGMSPETRAKIFEPFFTTKFTGRGLGLAAVLGVVRSHGGAIIVESEVGKGTTFKVLLPCVTAPPDELPEAESDTSTWIATGTVLVVDDEELVRTVTVEMLESFGFKVLTACDGLEGVETFSKRAGDIRAVVLDMTMPQLNGEEAFREMRRVRPDARILLVTGYSEQEAMNRFAGQGLSGFLQKPFKLEDLRKKMRSVLEA